MQVDVAFEFAKVYNVDRIDVVAGQPFTLYSDYDNGKWFSDNDPALSIKPSGKDAELKAIEKGSVTILVMDENFAIQKKLSINVMDAILPPATDLGLTAGTPEPK
jgi:hypothetical protein